ncbi:hypothetical protein BJ138DRAFT_133067 [Hygrophoropsis aurantiaca]|uniref:Uncharacterized protein n=1 Tax=Hygrophoropsis aurantiaca TaxID=72124 RepID=A0ACB8AB02_9AGAM|nr:hypothetical protein BJ138DRAFT_133067 [Hygrophoropsis aurantiaca]
MAETTTPISHPSSPPTHRLPEKLSIEIEVILGSQQQQISLLIIMSRACPLMPSALPIEYAYPYLGFFFISDSRAEVEEFSQSVTADAVHGRVRWRFTLEWAPGGERALFPESTVTTRPWWVPPSANASSSENSDISIVYRPRNLDDQYYSLLPLDLIAQFAPSEFFPRGFWCSACGLVNEQKLFRHQICTSSRCQAAPDEESFNGHVDPLSALRDLHQAAFLPMPHNTAPPDVPINIIDWEDGMRTITYQVNPSATVTHIFTGNHEDLQNEPSEFLHVLQEDVQILRKERSNPYFTYLTTMPDLCTADAVPWLDAPTCLPQARDLMLHYAESYGERKEANIDELLLQAWVAPGSKKGKVYEAKESCLIFLCLGAEVTMNFIPKGGFSIAGGVPRDPVQVSSGPVVAGPPPAPLPAPQTASSPESSAAAQVSPTAAAPLAMDIQEDGPPEHPPRQLVPLPSSHNEITALHELSTTSTILSSVELQQGRASEGSADTRIEENPNISGEATAAEPESQSNIAVSWDDHPADEVLQTGIGGLPDSAAPVEDDDSAMAVETAADGIMPLPMVLGQDVSVGVADVTIDKSTNANVVLEEPLPAQAPEQAPEDFPMSAADVSIDESTNANVIMEEPLPKHAPEQTPQDSTAGAADVSIDESTNANMIVEEPLPVQAPEQTPKDFAAGAADVSIDEPTNAIIIPEESPPAQAPTYSELSAAILEPQNNSQELALPVFGNTGGLAAGENHPIVIPAREHSVPTTVQPTGSPAQHTETPPSPDSPSTANLFKPGRKTKQKPPIIPIEGPRGRRRAQEVNRELSITLIHGDGLLLMGDDFECQIKRTGTTILLVGSSSGSNWAELN